MHNLTSVVSKSTPFKVKRGYWLLRRRFIPYLRRELFTWAFIATLSGLAGAMSMLTWFANEVSENFTCTMNAGSKYQTIQQRGNADGSE